MSVITPYYISCDSKALYKSNDFPGSDEEREAIDQRPAAGRFVCNLFPAYCYQRPLDLDQIYCLGPFKEALKASRTLINNGRTGPPSNLYHLRNVVVRDRVIYLNDEAAGFPIVYETHRPIDRANSSLGDGSELRQAVPFDARNGQVLFLQSTGCFNYGHWLVDDLSRLSAFREIRRLHPGDCITVVIAGHSEAIDRVKKESLRVLFADDGNATVASFPRPSSISFENLYFATPTTVHSTLKSPEAMDVLRLSATQIVAARRLAKGLPAPALGRRLFIDRGASHTRTLRNGAAVFAALEPLGFEHHTLEAKSFEEQVAIFSEAVIVVGNMGAGMTNTVFCRAGTPILNLSPEGWDEPFFWDLATVMGHRHHAMYGMIEGESFHDGYTLDPSRVLAKVEELIA